MELNEYILKQYNVHLSDWFNAGYKIKVYDLNNVLHEVRGLNDIYFRFPYNCYTDDDHMDERNKVIICKYYDVEGLQMWEPQTCYKCVLRERQDKDHYVCLAGNGIMNISEIKEEVNCDDYSP